MKNFTSQEFGHAKRSAFTVRYSFVGEQRICEVKELEGSEASFYKCRLLPSTLEITIRQITAGEDSKWIHNKGIVDDLAGVLGGAIENYKSSFRE